MGQETSAAVGSLDRWCKRGRWVLCKLKAIPTTMRVVLICIAVLVVFSVTNLIYQILHKPTEVFALIPGESNKAPVETWRQYGPLFREYSTASIAPELLAALAQVESAGNPIARTYWRWSLTSDPFAVYQPASSAVGMYQMTDAALSEAQGYCILHHSVVETGCSATLLHSRVVPRHATELTAVFLDRKLAAILGHRRKTKFSRQQREQLAAIIHLCGAGPAKAFALRGFRLVPGERCGDHDVSAYLDKINAMKREFLRFAADK
jgi:Transglycosylase SLT domain